MMYVCKWINIGLLISYLLVVLWITVITILNGKLYILISNGNIYVIMYIITISENNLFHALSQIQSNTNENPFN